MTDEKMLKELDRNMDRVFDAANVLNCAMTAIMNALPPESAALVVPQLDADLEGFADEDNPPDGMELLLLRTWRNQAARRAGLPGREWPE